MTAPASLPALVGYVIESTLGPSAPGGSEAIAVEVRAAALELLAIPRQGREPGLRDFHGTTSQRLRALALIPPRLSVMAELARVAQALRESP